MAIPTVMRPTGRSGGTWLACLLLGALLAEAGCGRKPPDYPYVGNMDDSSYAGQVTPGHVVRRVTANGSDLSIAEFEGRFVWADYAAPWCEPCVAQARAIISVEKSFGEEAVFLTVMTSASPKYEDVPDRRTAQAWARRFRLDPERVVAATNLWAWTIPTHILFSPEGQALYRFTGYLSAEQIEDILSRYMRDWEKWSSTGETADWMRSGGR